MSEEEKTDEEQEAPPDEAPAEADAEEAPETPADETPAEDAPEAHAQDAEEAPADDAPAEESEPTPAPAATEDAEPEQALTPKQLRKSERSRHQGEAKAPRSIEERVAERAAARRAKAASRGRTRPRGRSKHQAGEGTPPAEREPGSKKVRRGTVVSSKADKTITVKIEVVRRHPVYEKVVRRSATVHAHDERNDANAGDTVRVIESRPLSKTKRWRLLDVLERAR